MAPEAADAEAGVSPRHVSSPAVLDASRARLEESAYVGLGAFLVATLTFDPAVRLDSQDVLGHVWFVDSAIAP